MLGTIPIAGELAKKAGKAFKANQGAANMDAMLDLLKPKGQAANIGFEKGAVKKDGIAKFTSPNGSTRYVMMDGGEPVSALQIMSRDGKDGVISNVFTLPSNQKRGLASKLMSKAKKDFKSIKHSDELTEQGARFANSVEGTSQAPVDVASNIKPEMAMDDASRMARADEQGLTVDALHGTTHDFEEFGGSTLNKEGHFGAGHYFSSDVDDVNVNYAKVGPDLSNRIFQRMDQIEGELEYSDVNLSEYIEEHGIADMVDPDDDLTTIAREQAYKELVGHEGMVMPVRLNTGKEFDLIDDTRLGYERDVPAWEDYLDDADGDEDIARELAGEASWENEPEGELVNFMESIKSQADDMGFDADEVIGNLQEAAQDGDGLSASEIDSIMRDTEWFAEDPDTGDMINNEVYRQAIQDSGFDSIKHSGNIFQGMDTPDDTVHRIVFEPNRIRSRIGAKFDPKNKGSASLLGGLGAVGLGVGLSSNKKDDKPLN
tara:strand:+ start:1 stop:1464 length:1464 start_codon:yes stop_codon:yes gene_type:complete